jgi:hypothetical protein
MSGSAPTLPSVPQKLLAKASTQRELHFSSVSALPKWSVRVKPGWAQNTCTKGWGS